MARLFIKPCDWVVEEPRTEPKSIPGADELPDAMTLSSRHRGLSQLMS
jgi:hypothetical protein